MELLWRKQKLIRPTLTRIQCTTRTYTTLQSTHHTTTHRYNTLLIGNGIVYRITSRLFDAIIFAIHLVLGQIFNLNLPKRTQTQMQSDLGKLNSLDIHSHLQLTCDVQLSRWRRNSSNMLSEQTLIPSLILFLYTAGDILWNGSFTQFLNHFSKFIVRTVKQKANGPSATCCIINYFRHQIIVPEIQFITDTNLTRWIYQNIPQTQLMIQFTKQKHLNLCASLFFLTVHARCKHLCIVHHKHIVLVEYFKNILKTAVLDATFFAMDYQ